MLGLYVSDSLLFAGAIASFLLTVRLAGRAIREHVSLSEKNHRKNLEHG
jgi:hypothetical protein